MSLFIFSNTINIQINMIQDPLVTIGITSFNAEENIERCILSALNQTHKNKEIIIVDDGSSDRTPQILFQYEKKYPEIKVIINEKNYNCAYSLNVMHKEAKGEFIVYFDDDDHSKKDRVSKQLSRLLSYEIQHKTQKVFVYTNRDVKNNNNNNKKKIMYGIGRSSPEPRGSIVADYLLKVKNDNDNYIWGEIGRGTMFARLKLIKELGDFDKSFNRGAEIDLAVRAALKGFCFISVDECLVDYYITKGSHKTLKKDFDSRIQLIQKHQKYLKKKSLYLSSFLNFNAWYWHQKNIRIFGWFFRILYHLFRLKNKII